MADRTKTDEFKEAVRISDKDWAFNDLRKMVEEGTGWEALGHNHPAKRWGMVRANLEIQGPEGILTYRGKEVMPPSKLREVLASIHMNHKGTIRSQSKARQK